MWRRIETWLAGWSRRRQGEDTLPTLVRRQRLYILPTRGGVAFAVLVLFMLVAGLNYTNSFALFLTFWLTGFALVAMHRCHRVLLGIALQDATAAPAFAGDSAQLQLKLRNDAHFIRHRVEASALTANSLTDLHPHKTTSCTLTLPTIERGVLAIERLRLSTTSPFGLFRAWTWIHLPLDVVVYPRPRGSLPMPAESGERFGMRSRAGAGTEEWLGLRPFRDGDSPRQVDWKAYARGAALLVKEYSAAGSDLRHFDFSQLPQLDTEARLQQLSRWIVDAEARGESYGLALGQLRIDPHRGPQHRHRCLTALARWGLEPA